MSDNPYAAPEAEVQDITPDERQLPLASLGSRFVGALLDFLVAFVALIIVFIPLGIGTDLFFDMDREWTTSLKLSLLGMVIVLAIQSYFWHTRGQSIGKMLVGTRIVDVTTGQQASFGKIVGARYIPATLLGYIPIVGTVFGLVNILFVFRQDRRCIHDLIAGTKVVDIRK